MTPIGYAPTETITRIPAAPRPTLSRTTSPAPVILGTRPGTFGPGTPVVYFGSSLKDHGRWIVDGPCFCGCGKVQMWREEADGWHRLVHVSLRSVQRAGR